MDKNKYINNKIHKMVIFERQSGSKFVGHVTENGQRKSFYGPTKTDVKKKARDWLSETIDRNSKSPDTTLGDFIEYWLKTYKLDRVEITTYEKLVSVYEHQIKHQIGNVKLKDLRIDVIQNLIANYAHPKEKGDLSLAYSGLKRLRDLLNACLNVAVEEGLMEKNPCKMVKLPKKHYVDKPTKKQFAMSDEQIEEFKKACLSKYKTTGEYKSRDGLVLLIILSLGLRAGEALALDWEDVDFKKKYIHIRKTLQESRITGYTIKDGTKTPSGVRTLPINESVIRYLRELQEYDQRNSIESECVCCTSVGTRQTQRNLQRSLARILSWTTITDPVSPHTLRHTFGSYMLRKGVNVEVVSKLMGHSSITITYNKYIHVLKEQQAEAIQMIEIV